MSKSESMTPRDASRVQSQSDRTGRNQGFKARAQSAAGKGGGGKSSGGGGRGGRGRGGGGRGGKGGGRGGRPANAPSTTGNKSGGGRGNNPPRGGKK